MGKKSRRRSKKAAPEPTSADILRNVRESGRQAKEAGEYTVESYEATARQLVEDRKAKRGPEVQKLIDRLPESKVLSERQNIIWQLFKYVNIDMVAYDADPYGDGDQSDFASGQVDLLDEIRREHADFWLCFRGAEFIHKECKGTDTNFFLNQMKLRGVFPPELADEVNAKLKGPEHNRPCLSEFAYLCAIGNDKEIKQLLRKHGGPGSEERRKLLERRETSFRLTPLMVTVFYSWFLLDSALCTSNHEKVVSVLLQHGANLYARDITGRTVIHYAADPQSGTEKTLQMARMCLQASSHCHHFKKVVILDKLAKNEYNGMKCFCGGFDAILGRLSVFPLTEDGNVGMKNLGIKPENIFAYETYCNLPLESLVDAVTRSGSTALSRVTLDGTRDDIASFLLKYGASVDIGRISPRHWVTSPLLKLIKPSIKRRKEASPVDAVIKKHIAKLEKAANDLKKFCGLCGKPEGNKERFPVCAICESAWYCGCECQKKHWEVHRKVCSSNEKQIVKLGPRSSDEIELCLFGFNEAEETNLKVLPGGYNRPQGVKIGERFKIKAVTIAERCILFYDKSRTCCFLVLKETQGFSELFNIIRPAHVAPCVTGDFIDADVVKRLYFQASFEQEDECCIYLNSAFYKTSW